MSISVLATDLEKCRIAVQMEEAVSPDPSKRIAPKLEKSCSDQLSRLMEVSIKVVRSVGYLPLASLELGWVDVADLKVSKQLLRGR